MLALGVGNAWAETVTFTPSNCTNWTSSQAEQTQTIDGITLHSTGAANNTQLRLYSGATHTFTSTVGNITNILFTCTANGTSNYGPGKMTGDGYVAGTGKTGEWTGNSAKVTLTGGQSRCTSIVVTYTPSSGGTEPPTPAKTYDVTWMVNGEEWDTTEDVEENTQITTLPTEPTDECAGKVFQGWTDKEITDGQKPAVLFKDKSPEITDGLTTFYAVFATESTAGGGGTTTETLKGSDVTYSSTSSGYKSFTATTASGTWTGTANYNTQGYIQINKNSKNYHIGSPVFASNVKSIKFTTTNNSAASRTFYICSSNSTAEPTSGDLGSHKTTTANESFTIDLTADAKQFYIYSSGAVYISQIDVILDGGSTISDYTTSCDGSTEPVPSVTLDPSSKDFGTVNVGENPSQEFTITTENTTATLTASIDDNINYAVSAIDGNKVTVTYQPQSAATHPAVLTVKAGEEATATVNLTGKAVQALEGTWILVTDASSLNVGDKIIIAAKESDVALSTTQASNNRPEVAITKNDNTITATSETQVLTLEAGNKENTLALYTGDGYLYAASSSSNWLRTETTLSDNSSWTISIADGTATLTAQGTNTKKTLYYNKNSKIFSCYSNAQQPIALYKNTNGQQLAGLAYATTKYLTKLGDAFTTPTLTNPNSLTVTYSSSDNNVATVDNTGTVTIKAAGVVVITAAFAGDASYLEGSAKYTLCVTEHAGTEADPYSVADARRVIDVMETAEGVYATGIVSEIVDAYNATYGNITYNISIDGSTAADQLQAYRGKGVNGENFSSANDIKVGDEVIVKGNLKKYETTYEFDADNQLVSLKRDKQQAGLAYEEKEHTANVGEDFTEPALTNPNSLTVTYSSSNTALATVDATTGEVSILAAGKVTITASSAADATYAAGSASYNIIITDPSLAVATLPFYFDGKKADIEGTAGMTQSNLGTDYTAAPYLKFNEEGAWAIVQFDSEPGEFSFLLKQNGNSVGTFTVYESANGEDYTPIWSGGDLGGNAKSATIEPTLSATARYVKFEYTTKPSGTNYGLGSISIQKADHRAEAGIAWNPATVSLTVGDAFTTPTFNNPNGLSGITFASSNETLATVDNEGAITLVSGKTGTATITATFADGHATYKPAEATCVITVSPKSEKVVILAQYNGQWYALKAAYLSGKTDRLDAIPVNYVGGKLYNVAEADKASIEWSSVVEGDKVSFINDGKYLKGKTTTTLLFEENADGLYQWDNTTYTMTIGTTVRSFLYNGEAFRNFAVSQAGKVVNDVLYSSLPVVTAPVYATGDAYGRSVTTGEYGTICIPYGSSNYTGAEFYEISWMEMDGTTPKGIWLDEVTGALTAGKPYIFKATADEIAIVGDGTTAAAPVVGVAGLTGTFTLIQDSETSGDASNKLEGNYMIAGNKFLLCPAGCWLNANRAYIDAEIIANHTTKKEEIPGRRRVCMGETSENEATGFENIVAPEGQAVKAIVNGQLIIIRDGVKYNVQGQKL